jgi:aldose sugar dehydrogenase
MKMHIVYYFLLIFVISILCYKNFPSINADPVVYDKTIGIDKIIGGINYPVSMSFLGPDDIIILEKNTGTVKRIVNGQMMNEPLLEINVEKRKESGLTGSAVAHNTAGHTFLFLYFTKNNISSLNETAPYITENNLYRYEFIDGNLVNPKLLYKIPTQEQYIHNSGKMVVGPDNYLYLMVGDLHTSRPMLTGNYPNGSIDGSGGIIRLTLDGLPAKGILSDYYPLNLYYAYGIRNGFGMDFDPITGHLWDTENGPSYGDEINLIHPGFNSGWKKVQGIWQEDPEWSGDKRQLFVNYSDLVSFSGKGQYSSPEYIWNKSIGVTSIKFFNSTNLGKNYANDMFVGDYNNGILYHFDLNNNRTKVIDRHATVNKDLNNEDILIHDEKGYSGCITQFACEIVHYNNTNTNPSKVLNISTISSSGIGSNIDGRQYDVIPKNKYTITATMKLNNHTTQSNIKIEGYNSETSLWEHMRYCTDNLNGPMEWKKFDCVLNIPDKISKIRPIINGGYSSDSDEEAVSYFANIGVVDKNEFVELFPDINYTDYIIFGKGFGHITDIQMGPDGNLYVLALLGDDDTERSIADKNITEGAIYRITKHSNT